MLIRKNHVILKTSGLHTQQTPPFHMRSFARMKYLLGGFLQYAPNGGISKSSLVARWRKPLNMTMRRNLSNQQSSSPNQQKFSTQTTFWLLTTSTEIKTNTQLRTCMKPSQQITEWQRLATSFRKQGNAYRRTAKCKTALSVYVLRTSSHQK